MAIDPYQIDYDRSAVMSHQLTDRKRATKELKNLERQIDQKEIEFKNFEEELKIKERQHE